tara:strand:- start:57 stop:374 length:318 start_codon:yes stop_codon:yes gene_type:complete
MWTLMDKKDITNEILNDTINKKKRDRYKMNKDEILLMKKKWYQKNKERLKQKYQDEKKERLKEASIYYKENKEIINKKGRERKICPVCSKELASSSMYLHLYKFH